MFLCESPNPTTRKLAIELVEKLIIIYKDPVIKVFLPKLEEMMEE